MVAPKKLLKLRDAGSNIEDFQGEHKFSRTIKERDPELINPEEKVERLVLCSGQIYYELRKERNARERKDTAIVTVE